MITEILDYTRKYYPYSLETNFSIVTDGIEGSFGETYLIGQYINIQNSVLNDGTYKITAVTSSKLTLEGTFLEEPLNSDICVWGLRLPKGLLSLVTEIEEYNTKQSMKAGISSESQGKRSVTYKNGSSWQAVFRSKLEQYMSLYDDRTIYWRDYNMRTKGCY